MTSNNTIPKLLAGVVLTVLAVAFSAAMRVDAQLEGPYSYTARSATPVSLNPLITAVPTTVVFAPSYATTNTVDDRVVIQQADATFGTAYSFNVQLGPAGGELADWYVTPGNTNVATNANAYNLYWRSNGVTDATITVWNTQGVTNVSQVGSMTFTLTTGQVVTNFISAAPGSARQFFTAGVDSRLGLATNSMAENGRVYSTQNHTTTNYVRNTSGWWTRGTNADFTAISPWNSRGGATRAGVLVTPQHAVAAAHYPISAGATMRFVDSTNGVVTKTVTHQATYPGYIPYYPDLQVLRLDSAVDTNRFRPVRVLPANWRTYFPTDILDIPVVGFDQEEKALLRDGQKVNDPTIASKITSFKTPGAGTPLRNVYYEGLVVGDSGNPAMLLPADGGSPVLLTVWTYGGAGSGTSVTDFVSGLNSVISNLDAAAGTNTGYQLQTYDLSPFNAY